MKIRLQCQENHTEDMVIDPMLIGSGMVAGFLNRYQDEIAALIDGSSKLYVVKPSGRRCPVCARPQKASAVHD